jgi:hypothetical protein
MSLVSSIVGVLKLLMIEVGEVVVSGCCDAGWQSPGEHSGISAGCLPQRGSGQSGTPG